MNSSGSNIEPPRKGELWVNPSTNELLQNKSDINNPSLRHYFGSDVRAALSQWGTLNEEVAALSDVHRIIAEVLDAQVAKVHEVYFPDSKSYVAIILDTNIERVAIFVAAGYVDHYAQLSGSCATGNKLIWRTLLPTSQQHSTTKSKQPIRHVLCPHCYDSIPITGLCHRCDWSPNPYDE